MEGTDSDSSEDERPLAELYSDAASEGAGGSAEAATTSELLEPPAPRGSFVQPLIHRYVTYRDEFDSGQGTLFTYKFLDHIDYKEVALRSDADVRSARIFDENGDCLSIKKGDTWFVTKRIRSSTDNNVYLQLVAPHEGWLFAYDFDDVTKNAVLDKPLCKCIHSEIPATVRKHLNLPLSPTKAGAMGAGNGRHETTETGARHPDIMYYTKLSRKPVLIIQGTYAGERAVLVGKGRGWYYVEVPPSIKHGNPSKSQIVPVRSSSFIHPHEEPMHREHVKRQLEHAIHAQHTQMQIQQISMMLMSQAAASQTQAAHFSPVNGSGIRLPGTIPMARTVPPPAAIAVPVAHQAHAALPLHASTIPCAPPVTRSLPTAVAGAAAAPAFQGLVARAALLPQPVAQTPHTLQAAANPGQIPRGVVTSSYQRAPPPHPAVMADAPSPRALPRAKFAGRKRSPPQRRRASSSGDSRALTKRSRTTGRSRGRTLVTDKLRPGARLKVFWESQNQWFKGTLRKNWGGSEWQVFYDNDRVFDHDLSQWRHELLPTIKTCAALSKKGTRCQRAPVRGFLHCYHHATAEERKAQARPAKSSAAQKPRVVAKQENPWDANATNGPALLQDEPLAASATGEAGMLEAARRSVARCGVVDVRGARAVFEAMVARHATPFSEHSVLARIRQLYTVEPDAAAWLRDNVLQWNDSRTASGAQKPEVFRPSSLERLGHESHRNQGALFDEPPSDTHNATSVVTSNTTRINPQSEDEFLERTREETPDVEARDSPKREETKSSLQDQTVSDSDLAAWASAMGLDQDMASKLKAALAQGEAAKDGKAQAQAAVVE